MGEEKSTRLRYGNRAHIGDTLPELPEVETTRRHLESAMVGRVVEKVEIGHERTTRYNGSPEEVVRRLENRRVTDVGRHGKYLVIALDDHQRLLAHLGMSGRFSVTDQGEDVLRHTHFTAALDDGRQIRFVDPRTFGFIAVLDEDDLETSALTRLGPDAWSAPPDSASLRASLRGRNAPIKALLLDQRILSGLGNIYADEALHLAGINPMTRGGDLQLDDVDALLGAIESVLAGAIAGGGTTLDDLAFLLPDGRAGENLTQLTVYGREGEPCFRCGTPIERVVLRQRSTHFCSQCQP